MTKIQVDFLTKDPEPQGELLLQVTAIEETVSTKGNHMINAQMKVIEDPTGTFLGRMVFDSWVLETAALWRTKQALRAFLIPVGKQPGEAEYADLIGLSAWCLVNIEVGKGEYVGRDRARVKRYGIQAPSAAATDLEKLLK